MAMAKVTPFAVEQVSLQASPVVLHFIVNIIQSVQCLIIFVS